MNYEFFKHPDGTGFTRVSKRRARKAYDNGERLLIAPVNANMRSPWHLWGEVSENGRDGETFDAYVNAHEYYNCCNELGAYSKFFTVKNHN